MEDEQQLQTLQMILEKIMRVESEKGRTAAYRMRRDDCVIGISYEVREGLEKR